MRMSDIISSMGLAVFPILAMGLFLIVFMVVLVRVMGRERSSALNDAAHLPLADDGTPSHLINQSPAPEHTR